jgi:CubicO group peptidase (beta-lactamase class C family)
MNTPSRRSVLAALGATPLLAGTASADRTPDALGPGGELDRYIAELAAEGTFSGTVLLTHRKKTVLARSHGMADKARGIPNGPDTIFILGSITKTITGIALARLAERDEVAYAAKLGTYLDGFAPEIANEVTIHHLLTHTSGLGDFHSPEYFEAARGWDTEEEFWEGTMSFVRKLPLAFPPGAGNTYSNAGYLILGAIVAKVSGRSYYDYVREHVFERARMRTADFYTAPQWRADRRIAHPYHELPSGERVDALEDHLFMGLPAGGSFASAPDLVRLAHAFQEHRLLGEAFTRIVSSPKLPMSPRDNANFLGYSMWAQHRNGQWINGHNGGSPGVSCNLDWFPDSGWVAVVLSNHDSAKDRRLPAGAIADKARELITA